MRDLLLEKYISVNPQICGGKPCFRSTRIPVFVVLELLEGGVSVSEIVSEDYYPELTPKHVRAALHFAAEFAKHQEFVSFESSRK